MVARTDSGRHVPLADVLVAYRLLIYIGGLLVISIPLVLSSAFGVVVPGTARTVLVGVTLTVMIATYIAEHYIGYDSESENESRTDGESLPTYSLRLRIALALSTIGIAVGIYIALEIALFTGLLFIFGAYLFGYFGYRGEFNENDSDTDGQKEV
jgi:hypothetical protein